MNNQVKQFRIIIADAQYLTRKGLVHTFHQWTPQSSVQEVSTSEELWNVLAQVEEGLLVMDSELLDFSVPDDFSKILKNNPGVRILVITDDFNADKTTRIWDTGVNAFILKSAEESELELAFQACLKNQKYYAPALVDAMMRVQNKLKPQAPFNPLTPSEQDIVRFIAQGLTTKEIAMQKHLSFHTIITHRRNIFKKLEINNSSELLMFAIRNGIVQTNDYSI